MEEGRILAVAHEQHIADEGIQAVTQPDVLVAFLTLEGGFNLALGVILGLHAVDVVMHALNVFLAHRIGQPAEDAVQYPVGDERLGHQLLLEVEAVAADFVGAHAQRGRELSQQTVNSVDGDFPDAEEAQHVVDAVSVEILRHLAETFYPPLAAIGEHHVPVIGWEAPVLTIGREGIGRSTSLAVEVEVLGLYPSLDAVAADADGDVALEDDMLALGILVRAAHLLVQVVLHIVPQAHLLVGLGARIGQRSAFLVGENVVGGPLGERCRAIQVTIVAECGIGYQPVLIGGEECLELVALEHLGALLFKEQLHVLALGIVHALIVDLGQSIELFAQFLELGGTFLVVEFGQLAHIHVLRMQGIDADAVVGIAVAPCVGDGGVVDGKHLQGALAGLFHPVHHELEVAEVAHAKAALAAKREDGHHGAGQLDGIQGEVGLLQLIDDVLTLLEDGQQHGAVVTGFPDDLLALAAHDHELELDKGFLECGAVKRDDPLVVVVLGHLEGLVLVPVSQGGLVTYHTQGLAGAQLRGAHL